MVLLPGFFCSETLLEAVSDGRILSLDIGATTAISPLKPVN
jgi:hypothetical protein